MMKTRTTFLAMTAAIGLALSLMGAASAHGAADPQHGGIVATANDLSFELVATAEGVTIHVLDHDEPYPTAGITGKLTVLTGSEKAEADITSAGENRLQATGIQVTHDAKSIATLTLADQKTITVRFTGH